MWGLTSRRHERKTCGRNHHRENNDMFDAFLKITGYTDGGTKRIQLQIEKKGLNKAYWLETAKCFHPMKLADIATVVVNRNEEQKRSSNSNLYTKEVKVEKNFWKQRGLYCIRSNADKQ